MAYEPKDNEDFRKAFMHEACGDFHPTYMFPTRDGKVVPGNEDELLTLPCKGKRNGQEFEDRICTPDGYLSVCRLSNYMRRNDWPQFHISDISTYQSFQRASFIMCARRRIVPTSIKPR